MKRIITSLAIVCMYVCMYVCMLTTLTNTNVAFADLNDGLVAYYPFNGNANDESGNGNNGTVNGATLTTDRFGNTNKAYSFDGVDDYIDAGSNAVIDNLNDFSIIAWVKPSADSWKSSWGVYYGDIVSKFKTIVPNNRGWSFYIRRSSSMKYALAFAQEYTITNSYSVSSEIIDTKQWYYLSVVYYSSTKTAKLYINGTEVSYSSQIAGVGSQEDDSADTLQFGHQGPSSDPNPTWLNGLIDEIRLYNRALPESEIQELYNEGASTTPTPTATPTATLVQTPIPTPTVTETVTPTPTPSETGIVFGYVYDEDENPLRSVTVKIDDDDYSDSDTTDADGYYEFNNVPTGDYTITYTKTGYETQTMEVTVEEGDAVQVDSVTMPVVQKGSIYGYATNIRGDPIESVRLTLNGIGTKVKKTASTDSEGFFEFKDLEAGIYRIVAKKRFYKAAQQTVALEEGEDKEIEIEMKKTTKRIMLEGVLD